MTQFLGGVQLADNIQILYYKNDTTHWLSLYNSDKFIDFVTVGLEIHMLTASPCGKFVAFYQVNPDHQTLDFDVWKYDAEEQSLIPYSLIKTPIDIALSGHTVCTGLQAQCNSTGVTHNSQSRHSTSGAMDLEFSVSGTAESQLLVHSLLSVPEREVRLMDSRSSVGVYDKSAPHGTVTPIRMTGMPQICFNKKSTHVIGLGEWNHVYVINLTKIEPSTEFYIANSGDETVQQVIYTGPENYFAWFGQDEYVRIIDLNGTYPTMWSDKLLFGKSHADYNKHSKYFFEFCGYLVYMSDSGTVLLTKPNLQEKRLQPEYNIKYPVTKCTDITIIDGNTLCFHQGEDCIVKFA
jgi:hypothetical protein